MKKLQAVFALLFPFILFSPFAVNAQCSTSIPNYSTGTSNTSYAFSTVQTFQTSCSGTIRNVVVPNIDGFSDDLRATGYFVTVRIRSAAGTVLATGPTTDQWYPGATLTFDFGCANLSLAAGTTYQLEFLATTTTATPIELILFRRSNASVYANGNYIQDGTAYPAYDLYGWTVNLANGSIAASSSAVTQTFTASRCNSVYNSVPELMCTVNSGATNGISGSTTAKLWLETTQPASYVKRHYEITPATNASTATGKVTLYFTQAEFDAFNVVNTLKLPANSSDVVGKANLRIEKRGGISGNGTGLPSTYTGSVTNIDPADADIVWNSAVNRWEVSFDVIGFSGFFVKTNPSLLPLQWLKVNATLNSIGYAQVVWQVQEADIQAYTIERSDDGRNFVPAGEVNSKGNGSHTYSFTEATPLKGTAYYRIKQTGRDGKISYSETMRLSGNSFDLISVYPNPFTTTITLQSNASQTARVLDASGRLVQTLGLKPGTTTINSSQWSKGIYTLQVANGETIKLIKE